MGDEKESLSCFEKAAQQMNVTQELLQQFLDNGLAIFIILSGGLFLDRRVWVWFTAEYWPKQVEQQEEEIKTMKLISESLVALRMVGESAIKYHAINTERLIRIEEVVGMISDRQEQLQMSVGMATAKKRKPRTTAKA